jgi:hypothetical protein
LALSFALLVPPAPLFASQMDKAGGFASLVEVEMILYSASPTAIRPTHLYK